jgi:hypothetical protein
VTRTLEISRRLSRKPKRQHDGSKRESAFVVQLYLPDAARWETMWLLDIEGPAALICS